MQTLSSKKICITGGSGFLGTWVVRELNKEGIRSITIPRSNDTDLRDKSACIHAVQGHDILIHLAANVGGIGLNRDHPGALFYDNASMGIHLLDAARIAGIEKTVIIGTACSYPKYCPIPFHEDDLWSGYLDEVTGVYGMAKKMLLVQAQAYRKEYAMNSIYLILVNLYGPHDTFDPRFGHVIPSLIRRMIEAKRQKKKTFTVWGSGSATREFLYVEDAARGIVAALKQYNGEEPVNIGTGQEISIHDLVKLLKKIIGYTGEIVWDPTKPDGQPRRRVDVSRSKKLFGFTAKTTLEKGLRQTVTWYLRSYKK